MDDLRRSLAFALEKYPQQVEMVRAESILLDSARQNPKRPAYLTMAVPDEVVKGLRGRPEERDLLVLVRVPRQVLQRADSPIVLPGEVR